MTLEDLIGSKLVSIEELDDDVLEFRFDNGMILFWTGSLSLETTKAYSKRRKKLAELSQNLSQENPQAALDLMKLLSGENNE